jgi:hypothetical protein
MLIPATETTMSTHKTPESQKLIKLIESTPFTPDEKSQWSTALQEDGITSELAEIVHKALTALPADKFESEWQKAQLSMEFTALLNHWRMSQGSKHFKHNR